ncbi:MAG: hypothetical protein F6J93_31755 [Oscillatoria sp. SIO1A7]|nr:hypothetical protein [Oscillatoria sp. SIO1A7]
MAQGSLFCPRGSQVGDRGYQPTAGDPRNSVAQSAGQGSVQKRALDELRSLPASDRLRRNILEVVGM